MEDAHVAGAYDALYAQRRAEALEKDAVLQAEGEAGRAKAKVRKQSRESAGRCRKRKKEDKEAFVLELTQLMEQGVTLLGRLGCSAEKLGLGEDDGDKYGGLLETKGYKADVAALAKLEAKKGKTPEDMKAFTRKRNSMDKKRSRAFQRVAAEKAERRVEALKGRVPELKKEVCLLEYALSVI